MGKQLKKAVKKTVKKVQAKKVQIKDLKPKSADRVKGGAYNIAKNVKV